MSENRNTELTLIAARVMTAHLAEFERLVQTCITCEHFDEPREICNLAAKRPPAKVIAYGCNAWKERTPF